MSVDPSRVSRLRLRVLVSCMEKAVWRQTRTKPPEQEACPVWVEAGGGGGCRGQRWRGVDGRGEKAARQTQLCCLEHTRLYEGRPQVRERGPGRPSVYSQCCDMFVMFSHRGGLGGGGSHFTVWDPSSAGEWDQTGWDGMKGCRGWMRRRKNENKWDMRMFWEKMRTLLLLREESRWFFFIHLVNENIWDHNVETEVTPTLFFAWDEIWRVDPEEDVNFTKPAKWDDRIKHEMKLCDVRLEKTRKTIRNVLDGTDEMRWVQKI